MCEICNIERGNCELLVNDEVEVVVGKKVMTSHLLSAFIDNDPKRGYAIECIYQMSDDDPVATVRLPINYCPFCGRKLRDEEYKKYPWNE